MLTISYIFKEDRNSEIFDLIKNEAEKAGFVESKELPGAKYFSDMNQLIKILEVSTIKEFYDVLNKNTGNYPVFFNELIVNNDSTAWFGNLEFYICLSLMLEMNKKQLEELKISSNWSKGIIKQIIDAVIETKKL